jgi:hypothetical protein
MPIPYLKRLSALYKTGPGILQDYWKRAESLGKSEVETIKIFRNILSVSEDAPAWWTRLSPEEQKEYLTAHPGSKLVPSDHDPEADAPAWWLRLTEQEQRDYLAENPESELKVVPDEGVSVKSAAKKAWQKHRAKSATTLSNHKKGLAAIGSLLTGGSLNREQRRQAKATAVLGFKLVLGSLAGIAAFSIGAAAVPIVAKFFLSDHGFASESSAQVAELKPEDLLDKMHEWLINQDPKDLQDRIAAHK